METKFNFNSQVATTREQSERLLALGLKKETADMCYLYGEVLSLNEVEKECDIPAWSLHRLCALCKSITEDNALPIFNYERAYNEMIRYIEWLIKEGYFNKEYLNEHQVVVNEYGKLCSELEKAMEGWL